MLLSKIEDNFFPGKTIETNRLLYNHNDWDSKPENWTIMLGNWHITWRAILPIYPSGAQI